MSTEPEQGAEDRVEADAGAEDRVEGAAPEPAQDTAVADLVAERNVDGLLDLSLALIAGTADVERDPDRALRCYQAAADLGSPEGDYGIAVFLLSGDGDTSEATRHLRLAADAGHVEARVYLGNLYEIGLHYEVDLEKASVWYRSAARAAGIEQEPGTREHGLAMAELGCVREVNLLLADETVPKKDRLLHLRRAKALGYGRFLREQKRREDEALERRSVEMLQTAERERDQQERDIGIARTELRRAAGAREGPESEPAPAQSLTVGAGIGAAAIASVLLAVAGVAGLLATEGARAMGAERGLPLLGARVELVLPLVVTLLGAMPAFLLYRPAAVLWALVAAGLAATGGWLAWSAPTARVLAEPTQQATAAAVAGFLLALLVAGLRGGIRPRR